MNRRGTENVPFFAVALCLNSKSCGGQGGRSGKGTPLSPMWPGFDSQTRRHMCVESVGPVLCSERFFSGYSGFPLSRFPLSTKKTIFDLT